MSPSLSLRATANLSLVASLLVFPFSLAVSASGSSVALAPFLFRSVANITILVVHAGVVNEGEHEA